MTVYTLKKGKPKFDPSNWGDVMLGCVITLMIYFLCLTLSTVNQLNY
jgi:cell division protein FtsX